MYWCFFVCVFYIEGTFENVTLYLQPELVQSDLRILHLTHLGL